MILLISRAHDNALLTAVDATRTSMSHGSLVVAQKLSSGQRAPTCLALSTPPAHTNISSPPWVQR